MGIPMYRNAHAENSNAPKSENRKFEFIEISKSRFLMFGKAQIENSNVWKRENKEFQCLEKGKSKF